MNRAGGSGGAAFVAGAVRILAVAGVYFVAGKLALRMAIPPGYATAAWPAAGIALGAILLHGARVAPGVLVGSFFVNIWTSFDTSSAGAVLRSVGIASGIGVGAALQALVAASLVRRFVGFPTKLSRESDVAKFVLDRTMNHSPVTGRNTARSVLPSPS